MNKPVSDIRRENLNYLIEQYGSIANLNVTLGRKRKDGTLSQIRNSAINSLTQKPRSMGSFLAREIEKKLNLAHGWMDVEHDEAQPFEPIVTEDALKAQETHITPISKDLETEYSFKGIQISHYFIEKILGKTNHDDLKIHMVDDNSVASVASFGSLVLIDTSSKTIDRDGVYLLQLNDRPVLRVVGMNFAGGVTIHSDLDMGRSERLNTEDLKALKVIGRAVYAWVGKNL